MAAHTASTVRAAVFLTRCLRLSDVVGLALRFDALTIPRPGMVNEMEWSEVDWDAERWIIPAAKMKTGWDHVVPLSRQALAILSRWFGDAGTRRRNVGNHLPIQVAEWIVAVAFDIGIVADLLTDAAHAVAGFQLSLGFV
jgi:integrase